MTVVRFSLLPTDSLRPFKHGPLAQEAWHIVRRYGTRCGARTGYIKQFLSRTFIHTIVKELQALLLFMLGDDPANLFGEQRKKIIKPGAFSSLDCLWSARDGANQNE